MAFGSSDHLLLLLSALFNFPILAYVNLLTIIMTLSYLRYILTIFAGIQLASGQSLSEQ
jgi:hypothetical protein